MGAAQSSEQPPVMVFRGQADIPIQFSARLINSLEKREANASSPPSEAARGVAGKAAAATSGEPRISEAEIERRVAELVAAEKARLRERERALDRREEQLIGSALAAARPASPAAPTPADGRSVSIVAQDVEELMRKNKIVIVKPPDPAIAKAQQDVVECYRAKKGRTLDCWREVDKFRASVRAVEQEFIASCT